MTGVRLEYDGSMTGVWLTCPKVALANRTGTQPPRIESNMDLRVALSPGGEGQYCVSKIEVGGGGREGMIE